MSPSKLGVAPPQPETSIIDFLHPAEKLAGAYLS
jgi:hypothetical protein